MNSIKRQHSTVDESKNKKFEVNNLLTYGITRFEDMSNEILYEIFDFLDFCQAFESFTPLNQRFQALFVHSTGPIKIKLTSVSRSTFYRYRKQIILPQEHRIRALHLSNRFLIDYVFCSLCNGLKLTNLETLILEKIQSNFLENLLTNLLFLFYLSSLVIDCEDLVENRNNLYNEIFRLPRLKYCKLSINELNQSQSLPLATNLFSSIEHFILITNDALYDLPYLLSYMPHLKHLSIQSKNIFRPEQMQQPSSVLLHLTHLSLKSSNIPFDLFEFMVRFLFNQVQVFHLSTCSTINYFNADRLERLILPHMPQLRIFDLNLKYLLDPNQTIVNYTPLIDQFNAPFWSERQWFFQSQINKIQNQTFLHFFSIKPYRKRQYNIYDGEIDMNSKNLTWNSVRQLAIHDVNGTLRCKNYFPNVTDLTIFCHLNETNTNKLKSIIPLDRLTKLIFQSHLDDFIWIIKLLQYTPALLTLEIDDVVFKNSSLVKTKENEAFQLVSKINQIRNLIIRRYQIIHTEFLINLFPRLHQLSLPLHGDPKQLLQTLFSNKNHRLNELYLLHITNVLENDMKFMEKFIMEEKLLGQYLPEMKYNLLDKTMHVWW